MTHSRIENYLELNSDFFSFYAGMFIGMNAMEQSTADKVMKAAYDLFFMKHEQKENIKVKEGGFMRGYIPFGQESGLLNKYFEPKEGFSYGYSFDDQSDLPFTNALEGDNVWPDENHFAGKDILKLMFDMSTRISINIVRSISASYKHHTKEELGLILDGGDRISIMRLFHYFAKNNKAIIGDREDEDIIGSSPHTDWGLLTVITQQEQIGGLQAFYKGNWVDVPSDIPGSVVVNGGDFLSMVSKGRYISPVHRVQSPELQNRISYVYFYYPNFQTPLDMACSLKDSARENHASPGSEEGSAGQFNTLVSEDALPPPPQDSEEDGRSHSQSNGDEAGGSVKKDFVFGDFIINKWKGVFRAA